MENSLTVKNKAIDLWKQPGGTLGKVGLWIMGFAVVYGVYRALPIILAFTQNILTLTLMLMGLGCVLYVAFSPEMRRILKLFYLQVCRKLTGLIVEIDPIAILENRITVMKKTLKTVKENITSIDSTIVGMEKKLEEYNEEFEENVETYNKCLSSLIPTKSDKLERIKDISVLKVNDKVF